MYSQADRDALVATRQHAANAEAHAFEARKASQAAQRNTAEILTLLRSISTGEVIQVDLDALAERLGPYIPNRVPVLPDIDIERIRDDAVISGMELSKGHIRGSLIHLQRATTAPPPA